MDSSKYAIGSFLFDAGRGDLFDGPRKVELTGLQRKLLLALVESGSEFISKETLKTKVWQDLNVEDHAVSVNVSKLKKLVGGQIEPERNTGYRLRNLVKKAQHEYSFADVWEGAGRVGQYVFGSFKANAILTFAGHSAIFANLVLARYLQRKDMLEMPVYLALQRDWEPSGPDETLPTIPGYTPVLGEGVAVLLPDALEESKKQLHDPLRLAVIDDVIISAAVMASLRPYLGKRFGPSARIEFACFICFNQIPKVMQFRKPEYASVWSETESFTLPWGQPLWFGKQ